MQLPGGIRTSADNDRHFSFKPMTGADEMYLWEVSSSATDRLQAIRKILNRCVEISTDADALCLVDSTYLLARLAQKLGAGIFWLSAECGSCSTPFDVSVDLNKLPVKKAKPSYPFVEQTFGKADYKFRIPRLADLDQLDTSSELEDAVNALIKQCQIEGSIRDFSKKEVNKISQAFEDVAPEIPASLQSGCPECETVNDIPFDIAEHLFSVLTNPLEDVHEIASIYHWTEAEILKLPKARRHAYLSLISQARGLES